jgi:ABC-2 type transport system ATP-binding protein
MKRRLLIAKALVHDPQIVFLDEPTAGVDVTLRRDLWDYVRQRRAAGTTFILTTHYLEEAEQLADRVGVIDHGKLLLVDETCALLERLGRRAMTVTLATPVAELPAALAALGAAVEDEGRRLVFPFTRQHAGDVPRLLEALVASGLAIRDLTIEVPRLEQIFIDLIEKQPAEAT